MEYFPEGDLHTYLRDHPPLSEDEAKEVITQVLRGLSIMHKRNIAHRDIKPPVWDPAQQEIMRRSSFLTWGLRIF
jgi:serine/threonine protein kinase